MFDRRICTCKKHNRHHDKCQICKPREWSKDYVVRVSPVSEKHLVRPPEYTKIAPAFVACAIDIHIRAQEKCPEHIGNGQDDQFNRAQGSVAYQDEYRYCKCKQIYCAVAFVIWHNAPLVGEGVEQIGGIDIDSLTNIIIRTYKNP